MIDEVYEEGREYGYDNGYKDGDASGYNCGVDTGYKMAVSRLEEIAESHPEIKWIAERLKDSE